MFQILNCSFFWIYTVEIAGNTQAQASHFDDLISLLGRDELTKLFYKLGIEDKDIENAKFSANTEDPELQAWKVFYLWRRMNGRAANQKALLKALKNCRCKDGFDKVRRKWGIKGICFTRLLNIILILRGIMMPGFQNLVLLPKLRL